MGISINYSKEYDTLPWDYFGIIHTISPYQLPRTYHFLQFSASTLNSKHYKILAQILHGHLSRTFNSSYSPFLRLSICILFLQQYSIPSNRTHPPMIMSAASQSQASSYTHKLHRSLHPVYTESLHHVQDVTASQLIQ